MKTQWKSSVLLDLFFSVDSPVDLLVRRNRLERLVYRTVLWLQGHEVLGCLRFRSPLSRSAGSWFPRALLPWEGRVSSRQNKLRGCHTEVRSSSNKPGVESWATSGTTISDPVKSHLSPAWADSTASARKITSTLRGMLPRGSSACVSWMRTWRGTEHQVLRCHRISNCF